MPPASAGGKLSKIIGFSRKVQKFYLARALYELRLKENELLPRSCLKIKKKNYDILKNRKMKVRLRLYVVVGVFFVIGYTFGCSMKSKPKEINVEVKNKYQ